MKAEWYNLITLWEHQRRCAEAELQKRGWTIQALPPGAQELVVLRANPLAGRAFWSAENDEIPVVQVTRVVCPVRTGARRIVVPGAAADEPEARRIAARYGAELQVSGRSPRDLGAMRCLLRHHGYHAKRMSLRQVRRLARSLSPRTFAFTSTATVACCPEAKILALRESHERSPALSIAVELTFVGVKVPR